MISKKIGDTSRVTERTVSYLGESIVHLEGPQLEAGDDAPEVVLLKSFDSPFRLLADTADKIRLISAIPSLDTAICDSQTRLLHREIEEMGDDFLFITISADLPSAQDRWCQIAAINRHAVLSDYRDMSFGQAYGTHISEMRLEHRAIFIIDDEDVICYVQYLEEVHDFPDYDTALAVLRSLE